MTMVRSIIESRGQPVHVEDIALLTEKSYLVNSPISDSDRDDLILHYGGDEPSTEPSLRQHREIDTRVPHTTMTMNDKCTSDSSSPTESQRRKVLKGATSRKLGSIPAQGTPQGGSWLVPDGVSEQTRKRKSVPNETPDTGNIRTNSRYMLRPSPSNRIGSSMRVGNAFGALAMIVLAASAVLSSNTQFIPSTHIPPDPQIRKQAMSGQDADM